MLRKKKSGVENKLTKNRDWEQSKIGRQGELVMWYVLGTIVLFKRRREILNMEVVFRPNENLCLLSRWCEEFFERSGQSQ